MDAAGQDAARLRLRLCRITAHLTVQLAKLLYEIAPTADGGGGCVSPCRLRPRSASTQQLRHPRARAARHVRAAHEHRANPLSGGVPHMDPCHGAPGLVEHAYCRDAAAAVMATAWAPQRK